MEAAAGSCHRAALDVRAALNSLPSAPPPLAPLLWALVAFLVAASLGVAIAGRYRRRALVAADASCFWRLCSGGSTVLALAPQGASLHTSCPARAAASARHDHSQTSPSVLPSIRALAILCAQIVVAGLLSAESRCYLAV